MFTSDKEAIVLVDLSHHSAVMQEVISRCLWVRQYEADVEEVVTAHVEKGGTDGPVLREFVFRYANMRFIYPGGYVRMEVEVTTDVTAALHFYRAWVVEAERRVDVGLWPIGEAFDTAEGRPARRGRGRLSVWRRGDAASNPRIPGVDAGVGDRRVGQDILLKGTV
ncbi:hypothetical protein [Nonomuraea dietziae]|uniref:hypothetical protein n=1 Tax=Nonomuraea dietziae TaxID=65515 RepID=UPI0031DCA948